MNIAYGIPIIGCCVYVGMRKARSFYERRLFLEAVRDDIKRLFSNMEYARLPLFTLIKTLSPRKAEVLWDGILKNMELNEGLYEAYKKTELELLSRKSAFSRLKDEDRNVLDDFFACLGKGDLESEKKNAQLTLQRLDELFFEAKENEKKNSKLYSSLGLIFGLAIVLVLL